MRRDDMRLAMAVRDDGMRKVTRLTWRAGVIGVVCSALMAVAFGHNVKQTTPGLQRSPGQGTIIIPARPPAPARGAGQVTSGAS
jgi:hypothetical protein